MGFLDCRNTRTVKRPIDIVMSATALAVLILPMLLLAVLVRYSLGAPVLFRQIRPGKNAVPFRMLKLRTMREIVGPDGEPLDDAARLTRFGRFLRSTSLDELPELWNVLKGDMSLVGPRPLLVEYVPLYSQHQARRHEVRPGLTGWAQVNGRNTLTWNEKYSLDVWYVDNQSLLLDMQIIFRTVAMVLRRRDITTADNGTMPKFAGASADHQEL